MADKTTDKKKKKSNRTNTVPLSNQRSETAYITFKGTVKAVLNAVYVAGDPDETQENILQLLEELKEG